MTYTPYLEPRRSFTYRWESGLIDPDGQRAAYDLHTYFWTARRRFRKLQRQADVLNTEHAKRATP